MNILIDGNDRTKIGDFGLATRDFFIRKTATGEHEKNAYNRMTFSGRPSPLIRNVFYQMNRRRKIMIGCWYSKLFSIVIGSFSGSLPNFSCFMKEKQFPIRDADSILRITSIKIFTTPCRYCSKHSKRRIIRIF